MPAACFRPRFLGRQLFETHNLNTRIWQECLMIHSFSKTASPREHESTSSAHTKFSRDLNLASARSDAALPENVFHSMLTLERRRAERSRKPFVLMLLDANLENGSAARILRQAVDVILASERGTEIIDWDQWDTTLGAHFR